MNPIVKNVLAVVAGIIVGSVVNLGIVSLGPNIIPLPDGADTSTMEALRESMKLYTPIHFLSPFLAHALGTLAGAFVAAKFAATHRARMGIGIGLFFLLGGITAVVQLGGPLWFKAADLLLAYIPMGYLGAKLAGAMGTEEA